MPAEGKWLCQLTEQPHFLRSFFPSPGPEQVCSTLHQGSSSQGSFLLLWDSFPALLSSPHLTPNLLFHLHKHLYSWECSRAGHKRRPRSPILGWLRCEIWIKLQLGIEALFQCSQRGPVSKKLLSKEGGSPCEEQDNGQATASVTGDLGTDSERLFSVVRPRSKGDRGGYKSTQAKPFSTPPGFSQQGLAGVFSSASLFLGCSTGLLAGRRQELLPPPSLGRSRVVLWEWESDHQFLGMETVGKAFLIKTPILEARAEADTRQWSIKCLRK